MADNEKKQQDPEDCDNACASCGSDCPSRKMSPEDFKFKQNPQSNIKHIIAVVSGKGGVGKSMVTSVIASTLRKAGNTVGILDADITGPSIPRAFGVDMKLRATVQGMLPSASADGIQVVSTNLVLPEESTPVLWRGPVIANLVKQFYEEVIWGDIDYLLVDMPPGTGDVPLTVFQSLPINGVVIVTAPQDLVSMIVGKAINMATMMNVPVLGIVENMSYFECPSCGKREQIFGESKVASVAEEYGISLTAQLPINPQFAAAMDKGEDYGIDIAELTPFVEGIVAKTAA